MRNVPLLSRCHIRHIRLNIAAVGFRATVHVQNLSSFNAECQDIAPISNIASILLGKRIQLFALNV